MKIIWFLLAISSAIISSVPFSIGWRKLNYNGSKLFDAFVGGDAYNFIINASQSTSYIAIGGICLLCAFGFLIAGYLHCIYEQELKELSRGQNIQVEPKGEETIASKEEL